MSRTISVDFETFYNKKEGYGIAELGAWKYCDDSRFDPYLISVSDGCETWAGSPNDFNWDALDGATLLSHNKGFDATVYEAMVRKKLAPRVNVKNWHCTANMTAFLCNRRALADACLHLLNVRLNKETRDYANGKHWADIVRDGRDTEMLAYARGDALRCHQLFAKYGHLWPDRERALSELTIFQGNRGIQVDISLLREYLKIAGEMLLAAEATLPWVKEGKSPTSPKAVAEHCRLAGIPCPPVKSHYADGEARFIAWEEAYSAKHPWIVNVSNWRMINKFLASLNTIRERLEDSGIFHFGLKYFGAHTGRWSGDAGFNLQNLRKEPLFRDEAGFLITDVDRLKEISNSKTLPSYVTAVLDIRRLFIPRHGRKMIVSDLSQIEARVLLWLVGDKATLKLIEAGKSPYQAHAEATMGWRGGDLKKEDKELYALAKARVLGLGYGCGAKKFITVAQVMANLDITKDDPEFEIVLDQHGQPSQISGYGANSRRIVREYREQNPLIASRDIYSPGIWRKLDDGFKASEGGTFEMKLPSGRSMSYPGVRKEVRSVLDEETGKPIRKWVWTAMIGDRRFPIYGGLLTENAVQAISRDIFGEHLLNLQKTPGIDTLFSAHDEAVCEVDEGITARDVEQIMSVAPEWAPGLPLAAEAKEVPHYCK